MDRDARRSLLLVALLVTSLPAGTVQGAALQSEGEPLLAGPAFGDALAQVSDSITDQADIGDIPGFTSVASIPSRLSTRLPSVSEPKADSSNTTDDRNTLSQLDHKEATTTVSGVLLDNCWGKPLVGVTISDEGSSRSVTTDNSGRWSLTLSSVSESAGWGHIDIFDVDVADDIYVDLHGVPYDASYHGAAETDNLAQFHLDGKYWAFPRGNILGINPYSSRFPGLWEYTTSGPVEFDGPVTTKTGAEVECKSATASSDEGVVKASAPINWETYTRTALDSWRYLPPGEYTVTFPGYEWKGSGERVYEEATLEVENSVGEFGFNATVDTVTIEGTIDPKDYEVTDPYITPIAPTKDDQFWTDDPSSEPSDLPSDIYKMDINSETGVYELEVPEGSYTLEIEARDNPDSEVFRPNVHFANTTVTANSDRTDVDLEPEPVTITGEVTDQTGTSLEDVTVNVTKTYKWWSPEHWNSNIFNTTQTDADGEWEMDVWDGTEGYPVGYNITASASDSNVTNSTTVWIENIENYWSEGGIEKEVDLELNRSLHGQVTDTGSAGDWQGYAERPIPGVTIEVYEQGNPDEIVANTTTNAKGNWSVDVDPGEYVVNATLHAVSKEKDVSVSEDEEDVGVEVTHKLDVIRGQVWKQDNEGAQPPPAPDTTVTIEPVESDAAESDGSGDSDDSGDSGGQASLGTEPLTAALGQLDASAASDQAHQSRLASPVPRDALAQLGDAVESASNESVADASTMEVRGTHRMQLSQLSYHCEDDIIEILSPKVEGVDGSIDPQYVEEMRLVKPGGETMIRGFLPGDDHQLCDQPAGQYILTYEWYDGRTFDHTFTYPGEGHIVVKPTIKSVTVTGELETAYEIKPNDSPVSHNQVDYDIVPVVFPEEMRYWTWFTEYESKWLHAGARFDLIGGRNKGYDPWAGRNSLWDIEINSEAGTYTLTVPKGPYEFQIRGEYSDTQEYYPAQYVATQNLSASTSHSDVDLSYKPQTLTGRVTDQNGTPLEDVNITVTYGTDQKFWEWNEWTPTGGLWYWSGTLSNRTTTNESGHWKMPVWDSTTYNHYNITASAPEGSSQNSTWAGVFDPNRGVAESRDVYIRHDGNITLMDGWNSTQELFLWLDSEFTSTDTYDLTLNRTLYGQVTDTGSQGDWQPFGKRPIPNVTVEVYEQGNPDEIVANTTTNAKGNWSVDVDPGEYVVNATLHAVSKEKDVSVSEDTEDIGVEVTHDLPVIRGQVWQQDSEDVQPLPAPDTTVTIEPVDSDSSASDGGNSDGSDDSGGQASLSSAPVGSTLESPSLGAGTLAGALGQLDATGPHQVEVTGTVTDQDGQALANVTVVAEQRDAIGDGTRVARAFTVTDDSGTWSLTVPDGEYDIHAFYNSSDGQSGQNVTSREFGLDDDTATVNQTIDLSAGEADAYLFGTAVDIFTGDPVSSALVTVTETDTGDAETVPARSDGNWTLGLTAPGEYDFSATAEEYSKTVGNVTLAPGTVTFQFIPMVQNTTGDTRPPEEDELPPPEEEPDFGQFTGTVTDTDGEPIGGALVWGTSDAGAFVAETSADGTYKSREVPAGDYDLEAQKEGYENDEEIATLSAGETETVDFELEAKPAEVSGEVTDTQGEPIEGATITAEPTGETGEAWEATTDGEGAFGPKEVDPGEYNLTAEAEDYESVEKSITLEPEENRDLSFVLELKPANVTGTVTDTDGEPIGGATVEGTPADGDGGTAEEWSATTSGDGTYEATGVRPGSYEVTADADGYSKETKDLTLEATDEKTLDFTLEEQKCAEKTVPTNDSGVFWIGCPPGSYELTAEQTEGDQTASAKIEHEETTHEDLYFKTLTGEAVFEDGDYVPGSSLSVELINQETGETYTPDVTSAGTWRATVPTGTYTVRGTFDPDPSDDKKDVQEKTFEYTAENSHVTLVFGETDLDFTYKPTNPSAYEEVTFTLTKPEDVDNPSEVTWDFDLNDPAEVEPPVSGTTVTHSYIAPGTYDVQVSYNGQTATKTVTVGGELSVQSSYMGYGGIVMDRFDELETEVRVNLFSSSPLTDAQISLPGGEQLDTTIEQYGTADTPTVSATFDYSSSSLTPVDDYLTITATNEDGETVEKDIELDIRPAPLWALGLLQQRDNFGLERVTSSDGATVTIRDPFLFEESEWDSKNWPVVGYTGLSHKTEMAHVVTYDYAADDFDTKIDSAYILGVLNFEAGGEGTGTVNIVPEGSERLKFGGAEYDGSVDVGVSGTLAAGAVRILGWAITGTGALTFDWLLRWSEDAESFGDIENGTLAGGLDYQGGATGSLAGTASGIAGTAAVSGKVQVQVDIKPDQNPPFGPAYYYLLVEGALTGTTEGVSLNVGGKQTLIEWKGNLLYQDATPPVTGPFSLTQLSTLERQTAQAALTLGNFTSQIPPVTGTQPYENVSAVGTAGATGEATDALGGAATHARLTDRPHQDSAPAIAAVGDREVLAWQAGPTSETERGADIAVRIDEEGWGERTLVTDDDAYDAAPVLAADTSDGRLLAAWTRVEPYADPGTVASPEEQFPNYDVAIASAGADAPTDWSAPLVLSNNSDEQMDVSPSIVSVGENRWLVVWERNHNATFESTERSLRYALVEATDAGPTVLANGTLATEGVPVGPRLATAEDSDALVAYRSYAVTNGSLGQTPDVVALDLTVSGESVTATETVREETDGVVDLAAAGGHFVWATPTQQGRALVHHDGTETRTLNVTEEVISPGGLDLETHPESEDLVLSYNALTAARGESAMLYRVYHDGEWVTDRRLGAVDRAHRALEGATSVRASGLTRVTPIQPAEGDAAMADLFASTHEFAPEYALNVTVTNASGDVLAPGTTAAIGEDLTVEYTVRNVGDADASKRVPMALETVEGSVTNVSLPALAVGEEASGELDVAVPSDGTVSLVVDPAGETGPIYADPGGDTWQAREVTRRFASAALAPRGVRTTPHNDTHFNATVTIANDGQVSAEGVGVALTDGGQTLATTTIAEVAAGENASVRVPVARDAIDASPGTPERVVVDPAGELDASMVSQASQRVRLLETAFDVVEPRFYGAPNETLTAVVPVWNESPVGATATVRVSGLGAHPNASRPHPVATVGERNASVPGASSRGPGVAQVPVVLDDSVGVGANLSVVVESPHPNGGLADNKLRTRVGDLRSGVGNLTVDVTYEGVPVDNATVSVAGEMGRTDAEGSATFRRPTGSQSVSVSAPGDDGEMMRAKTTAVVVHKHETRVRADLAVTEGPVVEEPGDDQPGSDEERTRRRSRDDDDSPEERSGGPRVITDAEEIAALVELPAGVVAERAEQVTVESDPEGGQSVAEFTEASAVSRVSFEGSVSGEVTVTDIAGSSAPGAPGERVATVDVSVPAVQAERPARVQFRVSRGRLDALGVSAGELQVYHHREAESGAGGDSESEARGSRPGPVPEAASESEWESGSEGGPDALNTKVVAERTDAVIVEARTPGFSVFTVSAVSRPEPVIELRKERTASGMELVLDGSESRLGSGELVSYEWAVNEEWVSGERVSVSVEPGTYTVTLVVESDAGKREATTESITVLEGTPGVGTATAGWTATAGGGPSAGASGAGTATPGAMTDVRPEAESGAGSVETAVATAAGESDRERELGSGLAGWSVVVVMGVVVAVVVVVGLWRRGGI